MLIENVKMSDNVKSIFRIFYINKLQKFIIIHIEMSLSIKKNLKLFKFKT